MQFDFPSVGRFCHNRSILSHPSDALLHTFTAAEVAAALAKAAEVKRSARDGPCEGDLREMLAGAVDVTVLDAPRTLYEPRRKIPWGPAPTTGLTVAGTGEREETLLRR